MAVWDQVDLKRYTMDTYMRIVTYKTSFYSFYLPVACGLLVGGVRDDASLALARDICVRMGQYFQVPPALPFPVRPEPFPSPPFPTPPRPPSPANIPRLFLRSPF